MEPRKPQGSFGMPPEMAKQIEESRKNMAERAKLQQGPRAPKEVPLQPDDVQPPQPSFVPQAGVEPEAPIILPEGRQVQIKKLREELEKALGIEITAEDLKEYVFKGRLSKEIELVPDVLKAVFQTLTPDEFMEIDIKTAELRAGNQHTSDGIANSVAILNLSYAWTHANGRMLSPKNEPKKRESYIVKMGAHVVDIASVKLNEFNTLIRVILQDKTFTKKP